MNDKELISNALKYIRWIIGLIIFCGVLSTWGCASKERVITEYKTVKVPVKCAVELPRRPEPAADPVEMNFLILHYAEELETAIRSCL